MHFVVTPGPVYLFVYGTLRRSDDFPRHELLLPAVFTGFGTLQGKLYDLGEYPAATLSNAAGDRVRGEVYELQDPDTTLQRLDVYEGCSADDPLPHEYARISVPIQMASGETLVAQVYLYHRSVERLAQITSGDYLLWRCNR